MKLNLGCGNQVVERWINVDYFLGARLVKIPGFILINKAFKLFDIEWDKRIKLHDLTEPLPWKDNEVDVVYSSHTLEHLNKEDGKNLITEAHRVLVHGGIIRIIVPDLNSVLSRHKNGEIADTDLLDVLGTRISQPKGFKGIFKKLAQYPHQCMYSTKSLLKLLESVGFEASSRSAYDSEIDDIKEIELEDRTIDAVIIEGKKI